jgi:hypothetical protein
MNAEKYSVVVMSCDKYSQLWIPFVALFDKYWADKDSIAKQILVAESHPLKNLNDFEICSSIKNSWTGRLKFALEAVNTEYTLLLLEDYWFTAPVEQSLLTVVKNFLFQQRPNKITFHKNRPFHYKLSPSVPPFVKFEDTSDYLTSVQLSFWNTAWLKSILSEGMNPWEFETLGTNLIKGNDNQVYFLPLSVDLHENVLRRGVLHHSAQPILQKEGLSW